MNTEKQMRVALVEQRRIEEVRKGRETINCAADTYTQWNVITKQHMHQKPSTNIVVAHTHMDTDNKKKSHTDLSELTNGNGMRSKTFRLFCMRFVFGFISIKFSSHLFQFSWCPQLKFTFTRKDNFIFGRMRRQ